MTPKNGSKNAQNGSQQRKRLWPDSSVASKLTFEQRQLLPSQIKKLVARAERSNEPSTTALRQRQRRRRHHRDPTNRNPWQDFYYISRVPWPKISSPKILKILPRISVGGISVVSVCSRRSCIRRATTTTTDRHHRDPTNINPWQDFSSNKNPVNDFCWWDLGGVCL